MPTIDIDRDAARRAAQHELAKAIYPKPSARQRFHDLVDDLVFRLLEKASSVPGGWLTITALLMVLVFGVVVAIRVARQTTRTTRVGDQPLFDHGQLSAAQHRTAAQSAAAEGDWAAAVRHRLRAIARGFEESGLLDPMPGRTANELAAEAGRQLPPVAAELSKAAAAFNDITYGDRAATPTTYQMIADLDDHLRFRAVAAESRPQPAGARAPLR
ncbi:DUF4129 domain-containing protein [Mycobacterium sp.]|uniref:DUF4129 domain-containing protein n=1 Tax=Mycobacterium sp. TaxID=1785 RepID=UPI001274E1CB|nr:DUF4129 domain-containing protein [Mycobacterium sp.]KAA8970490.1 MAG: DUF4129 domain-containing protein [Mycobacterium sp.]